MNLTHPGADEADLLRAPPFPWVAPDDRRLHLGEDASAEDDRTLARAADAICEARVGGAFWGADDPWTGAAPPPLVAWLRAGAPPDDAMRAAFRAAVAGRRWRDPFAGRPASLLDTVALLAEWRRHLDANRRIGAAAGMARWKREAVSRFLWDGERSPPFAAPAAAARLADAQGRAVAAWPSRVPDGFAAGAWVEDGFLRSAGLGADLRAPHSLAVDFARPAFDPAGPSDLERLLSAHPFPPELVARAAALRTRLVAARLGKYGAAAGPGPDLPAGRRIVLAVGQVADDLSVRLGGAGLDMAGFLARVRAAEPGAWILWRPHPDVAAGHRAGHFRPNGADAEDRGSDLAALLDAADAVHVLSSLTGFEALLRGRPVVTHGRPFYAGWGLTRDLGPPVLRRTRRLTLDRLVAGALILYPRYLDPVTGLPCGPETLADRLVHGRAGRDTWRTTLRRAQGRVRRGLVLAGERTRG